MNEMRKVFIDKECKPLSGFRYTYTIDDINEMRSKGFGMHEAKEALKRKQLCEAIQALNVDPDVKSILSEILRLK